mmetsp:Transcript_28833/g.85117  ORF Transcript_28833/g.85117 Transcript_28833/m.85117 type:complete len:231 (-) Transcript_28833:1461-2153(-)
MTAVPRVALAISEAYPRSPREGISKVRRVLPSDASSLISTSTPFRAPVKPSMTDPEYSASTSTMTSSNGSNFCPVLGQSLVTIRGGLTIISYPSRRICSMSMPICNSPRPNTTVFSGSVSDLTTVMVTLLSVSSMSRERTRLDVTIDPSFPTSGPLFAPNTHDSVGGARGGVSTGRGTGSDAEVRVSPTAMASGTPARVTMSPATAKGGSRDARETPRFTNRPDTLDWRD